MSSAQQSPLEPEARAILELTSGQMLKAFELVERQLSVIVLRTQVLLSLCGIVITVTGFSGQRVAQTGPMARYMISTGMFVVLLAAAVAIWGVLRLRWLTEELGPDPLATVVRGLEIRNRRAQALSRALVLFVVGFALYCSAVAQLLIQSR